MTENRMTQSEMKKHIFRSLESNDLDAVVSLAQGSRQAMSMLVRLAYDKETLVGWRAIKAVGRVAKTLVKIDPEFLRITIRKLLWMLTDESGGIGWSAPELLGEIVSADPGQFADIIPIIADVYNIEEHVFRPGVVYALLRIAETDPERIVGYQEIIVKSLIDKDPLLKCYALELVKYICNIACNNRWSNEYIKKVKFCINNIKNDTGVAWIYRNNCFIDVQVGFLAKEVDVELSRNNGA
jgi:hypothetical protein